MSDRPGLSRRCAAGSGTLFSSSFLFTILIASLYCPALVLLSLLSALGQDLSGAPDGATLPLIVEIPSLPTAVAADGKQVIAYELHLTNWSSDEMILTRLGVGPPGSSSSLFDIPADALEKMTISSQPGNPNKLRIGPGLRATIFMFLSASAVPSPGLVHRIHFTSAGKEETLVTTTMPVRSDPVGIRAPLRGGLWRAVNGPNDNTHHRRGLMPYEGRPIVPQRFAIDFLKVDGEGKTYKGDPKVNANYLCYGAEALAVGAGTIRFVKDGIPDNVPHPTERALPMNWETVSGNFVVLDLGSDRIAVYAHLQPGSIRVKQGDRVQPGQVLGLVGNSGNSTESHLHFHICDAPAALGGDGVPFTIESFTRDDGTVHRNEIPLRDWNIRFP